MYSLTDFADQAVILPLTVVVLICLALAGWWRACITWLSAVGGTLLLILLMKAGFDMLAMQFGSDYLISPSGHVAGATVVYGGLIVLLLRGTLPDVVVAALPLLVACGIGQTRVALMAHTPGEVLAGAIVGLIGTTGIVAFMGPRPQLPRLRLVAVASCTVLLLHGQHLGAEEAIRFASTSLVF